MKNTSTKETEEKALQENWPLNAASTRDNENYDRKDDDEEEEDESGDWGDVDPNSGPEPTAPGSAV